MEDSFNVRVGKIFGSLPSSSAAASTSLWCLTDAEIERRKWNRDTKSVPEPLKELEDLDDEYSVQDEYKQEEEDDDPDWDIKASIGLDSTLDFEEEEDEYDRVAVGLENSKEMTSVAQVDNPKSILKRKNDSSDSSKSVKRVRFDPDTLNHHHHNHDDDDLTSNEQSKSGVPDYLVNPSRYTRYTLDCLTDMDETSNRQAYAEFLNSLKKEDTEEDDTGDGKPLRFVPRKSTNKAPDTNTMVDSCTQLVQQVGIVAISLGDESAEVCDMEQDDQQQQQHNHKSKPGRQYRVKATPHEDH